VTARVFERGPKVEGADLDAERLERLSSGGGRRLSGVVAMVAATASGLVGGAPGRF
jgi:hypothetical protein